MQLPLSFQKYTLETHIQIYNIYPFVLLCWSGSSFPVYLAIATDILCQKSNTSNRAFVILLIIPIHFHNIVNCRVMSLQFMLCFRCKSSNITTTKCYTHTHSQNLSLYSPAQRPIVAHVRISISPNVIKQHAITLNVYVMICVSFVPLFFKFNVNGFKECWAEHLITHIWFRLDSPGLNVRMDSEQFQLTLSTEIVPKLPIVPHPTHISSCIKSDIKCIFYSRISQHP